jgi:hypothetical protein
MEIWALFDLFPLLGIWPFLKLHMTKFGLLNLLDTATLKSVKHSVAWHHLRSEIDSSFCTELQLSAPH